MFYLTTHSTHFIYGYMLSDIWLRTILIVRKETRYSFLLAARFLLYVPSHRQDSTYHGLCYTSRGALAGTRNSSMKDRSDDPSHHERMLLPRSWLKIGHSVSSQLTHSWSEINPCQLVTRSFIIFLVIFWFHITMVIRSILHWAVSRSSQCSTTGIAKAMVCIIMSVEWCI